MEIADRYQVKFLEIGTDKDHVHFLVQSVPTYSVTKIVTLVKSLTAREVFSRCPQVKKTIVGASCKIPQPAGENRNFLLWPGIGIDGQRI
jgi:REP element-mobilizing transposase RayT